ncbi:MAG: hypothetical protein AB1714_06850 [Acidobacteriota bacterium]
MKLPKGSKLSGTVSDKAGRSLHGVLYVCKQGADPSKDGQGTLFNVRNGKFAGYLAAGTYDLVFVPTMDTSYKGTATQTHLSVTVAGADTVLTFKASSGVVVSGKVKDAAGKIAKYGSVAFYPVSNPGAIASTVQQVAIIDSKGSFRVCVPPGEYDLQAGSSGSGALALMNVEMPRYPGYVERPIHLLDLVPALLHRLSAMLASL